VLCLEGQDRKRENYALPKRGKRNAGRHTGRELRRNQKVSCFGHIGGYSKQTHAISTKTSKKKGGAGAKKTRSISRRGRKTPNSYNSRRKMTDVVKLGVKGGYCKPERKRVRDGDWMTQPGRRKLRRKILSGTVCQPLKPG